MENSISFKGEKN